MVKNGKVLTGVLFVSFVLLCAIAIVMSASATVRIASANVTSSSSITVTSANITDKNVAEALITQLGGVDALKSLGDGVKTADNFYEARPVQFSGSAGQEVTFNIMYVSKAAYTANGTKAGDIVVTLWDAYDTLTSEWNKVGGGSNSEDYYPTMMYSSSYIRSILVGTPYITETSAEALYGEGVINDKFQHFSQDGYVYDYLATPANMAWQETLSWAQTGYTGYNLANDAWGTPSNGAGSEVGLESKDGYADWKNDRIWLPALAETGDANKAGLWKTNRTQRINLENTSWLRSGARSRAGYTRLLNKSDESEDNTVITENRVRPAIHLNLTKLAKAAGISFAPEIYWGVVNDGTLVISGSESDVAAAPADKKGSFAVDEELYSAPWYDFSFYINTVQVKDGVAPVSTESWFFDFNNATSFDLSALDTSNVTNMRQMFARCFAVETLDLSGFDTSNVTNMVETFFACTELKSVDLSSFDTSAVTNMTSMFTECYSLKTLDLSNFDISSLMSDEFEDITPIFPEAVETVILPQTIGEIELPLPADYLIGNSIVKSVTKEDAGKMLKRHSSRDHVFGDLIAEVPASCTQTGTKAHKDCSVCGKHFDSANAEITYLTIAIDRSAHSWDEWRQSKAATCTEKGEETRVCTLNHEHKQTRPTDEKGHVWGSNAVRVESSCTEAGSLTYTCTSCGAADVQALPALGHHPVQHDAKPAACTQKGWEAYETCTRCDHTTYEEISALGHNPVQHDAKPATCTQKGWEAYETCTRCDHTTYEETSALGHNPVQHDAKPATCTQTGWEAYETCTRCDHTTFEETAALGHDYAADFTVDKAATCMEKGSKSKHCTRCGAKGDVTEIEMIAHSLTYVGRIEATNFADGNIEYWGCGDCDNYFADADGETVIADKSDVIIPKLPDASRKGLSAGAIAGIAIGALVFVAIAAYVACYFALYRRNIALKGKGWDAIYKPMDAIFGSKKNDE